MNILFTICGRAGSKGIKNKNIRDFLGYRLPLCTLSAIDLYLKRNPDIDCDIVVNSDSQELLDIICNNGKQKVKAIIRSEKLSGDMVAKVDVILDCLNQMEEREGKRYDTIVDLDITSPLRTVEDIENLINKKKNSGCDVAFSVVESRRNPYFNMVKKIDKGYGKVIPSGFVARQQAPEIYDMNASIYAYDRDYLRTGKGVFDGYCEIIKMYDAGILDLDHENDFKLMEVVAKYLFKSKAKFGEIRENLTLLKSYL